MTVDSYAGLGRRASLVGQVIMMMMTITEKKVLAVTAAFVLFLEWAGKKLTGA